MSDEQVEFRNPDTGEIYDSAALDWVVDREIRLVGQPLGEAYSGSVRRNCQRCGAHVWVGPRQQSWLTLFELRRPANLQVLCRWCGANEVATGAELLDLGNPEGTRAQ